MKNFLKLFFIAIAFGIVKNAAAAPCCAGSSALPAMITGDEAQSIAVGFSYSKVIADVSASGGVVFRDDQSISETKKNFNLTFASLIDGDRLQAGLSVPVIMNELQARGITSSSTALGDLSATLGYETLPEWEYSVWKPKIYNFLQFVFPTGKSIYDSSNSFSADVGGLGFWQIHFGTAAIKKWNVWDASAVFKIGYLLGRTFNSGASNQIVAESTPLMMGSLGAGISFADTWRFGMSLEPQYTASQTIQTFGYTTQTASRLFWNTGFTLTALVGADSSLVASYVDQTLMGPSQNTTLSRTIGFSYQYRFAR